MVSSRSWFRWSSPQGRVEKGWNWVAECNNIGERYTRKNVLFLRWKGEGYIPKNVFFTTGKGRERVELGARSLTLSPFLYPSLLSETRISTIPSSHATGRDPLRHTFDPLIEGSSWSKRLSFRDKLGAS